MLFGNTDSMRQFFVPAILRFSFFGLKGLSDMHRVLLMKISPVPLFIITAADLVAGRGVFCGLVEPT